MRIISSIVLFVALALTPLANQDARRPVSEQLSEELKLRFVDNQCMPKGGTGIINRNLYISVRSDKNKLTLGERRWTWTGKDASIPEVIIVFQEKVWSSNNLPNGFDLAHAIVISFEADKVRFFDFSKMLGGYYVRQKTEN